MYHMLTCFNLRPDTTLQAFESALSEFSAHMAQQDLLAAVGPIGRRDRHPVMDTDDERDHEYFFITSFYDRAQCDLAVAYIKPPSASGGHSHQHMYAKIEDPVFICWEDIHPAPVTAHPDPEIAE